MKIGAQLNTVREFTKTNRDFADTIKKISAMGYEAVLVSGVSPDIVSAEIAETCKAYNLEIAGSHVEPERIIKETELIMEEHQEMGTKNIGIAVLPERYPRTKFGVRGFMTDYIPAARQLKEAGFQMMYHNLSIEFMRFDGQIALQYIADKFPEINFNLDPFWVQAGGGDPEFWIHNLAGRINLLQVKDMVVLDGRQVMCEVMNGNLNWPAIIGAAKKASVDYLIVDQDECYGKDPFECLKISLQNINDSGLL